MVSIVAFQAIDPGSIPGHRIFFFFVIRTAWFNTGSFSLEDTLLDVTKSMCWSRTKSPEPRLDQSLGEYSSSNRCKKIGIKTKREVNYLETNRKLPVLAKYSNVIHYPWRKDGEK